MESEGLGLSTGDEGLGHEEGAAAAAASTPVGDVMEAQGIAPAASDEGSGHDEGLGLDEGSEHEEGAGAAAASAPVGEVESEGLGQAAGDEGLGHEEGSVSPGDSTPTGEVPPPESGGWQLTVPPVSSPPAAPAGDGESEAGSRTIDMNGHLVPSQVRGHISAGLEWTIPGLISSAAR